MSCVLQLHVTAAYWKGITDGIKQIVKLESSFIRIFFACASVSRFLCSNRLGLFKKRTDRIGVHVDSLWSEMFGNGIAVSFRWPVIRSFNIFAYIWKWTRFRYVVLFEVLQRNLQLKQLLFFFLRKQNKRQKVLHFITQKYVLRNVSHLQHKQKLITHDEHVWARLLCKSTKKHGVLRKL